MSDVDFSDGQIALALERKVLRSKWALLFERWWPRVWLVLAVVGLFLMASMAGLWPMLGPIAHMVVLGLFAAAAVAAVVYTLCVPRPTRAQAIARLERSSGIDHRPASSFEDTVSSAEQQPATRTLWREHRARLARLVSQMKVSGPRPDTPSHDPFALRVLLMLGVISLFGLVGGGAFDKIKQAFAFPVVAGHSGVRIDAWVAPPGYTGMQPVMLRDGGRTGSAASIASSNGGLIEVPANSVLIVRGTGPAQIPVSLEVQVAGTDPEKVVADSASEPVTPNGQPDGATELRYALTTSARVRLMVSDHQDALWTFAVVPDALPSISLSKAPGKTKRGSMKLSYKVTDDYGVASAIAKVVKAPPKPGDPATAWARKGHELKGPRFPLERPPELPLRLPLASAKNGEAVTHLELASHPWAGLRVMMTLEATDVAGQIGRSEPIEIVLPQRQFTQPLARAVIEQRRKLVEDSRYRKQVRRALAALTLEPEGFIDDMRVYLGLRSVIHRLEQRETRAALKSSVDQLWHIAVRIEDGDLSDAERRLREAQEKLAKALREGGSDEDIKAAMDELRQALNDYMRQLQKQAQDNPLQQGQDPQSQSLSKQDLDQMMRDIEEQARNGSREQAQQMLSELRDLLDRIEKGQSAQSREAQRQANAEAMRQLEELSDIVGKQQKLMDETFANKNQRGQQGQRGRQGRQGRGRPGQQGMPGQQGQGQRGQRGRGQRGAGRQNGLGQQQQLGQRGRSPGQSGRPMPGGQPSPQQLMERQRALANRLNELQREMERSGKGSAEQLAGAREAMDQAEQALEDRDYGEAARQQGEALEQMRQGAQQMAEEMSQGQSRRTGQAGNSPRDPLGRPQRSSGPQLGTSVKVPDEIDVQRAREILQELRRRVGDPTRPTEELDYFERLLRRF